MDDELGFVVETLRKIDTVDAKIRKLLMPRPALQEGEEVTSSILDLPEQLRYPFQDLLFCGLASTMRVALEKKVSIFTQGQSDILLVVNIKTLWK